MKIFNTNYLSSIQIKNSFKAKENDWHVFGFDESGESKRNYMREWHYNYYMPFQQVYEKETRLSEYALENLLKQFDKTKPVDNKKISKINLQNLEHLDNTNSYRGAMIKGYQLEKLSLLKEVGIKRIISLMKSSELEEECRKLNLEYLYFNMDLKDSCFEDELEVRSKSRMFWQNIANITDTKEIDYRINCDVNHWKDKVKNSKKQLMSLIQFMQKDNVYIGCACGTYRTDFAILLNFLFNPNVKYSCTAFSFVNNLKSIENLYNNLTQTDKIKLGWTKIFEEQFLLKLNKLKVR